MDAAFRRGPYRNCRLLPRIHFRASGRFRVDHFEQPALHALLAVVLRVLRIAQISWDAAPRVPHCERTALSSRVQP